MSMSNPNVFRVDPDRTDGFTFSDGQDYVTAWYDYPDPESELHTTHITLNAQGPLTAEQLARWREATDETGDDPSERGTLRTVL